MGISKRHIDTNEKQITVNFSALKDALKQKVPEIIFACVPGSAATSVIKPYSDFDLAVFTSVKPDFDLYQKIQDTCLDVIGQVRIDLGFLNNAEPVYRYEALKGKLLYTNNEEEWLRFYSLTCREYETQMVHYERQRLYRLEASGEI